ncbi:MAG: hypothetical protein M0P13_11990 [Fibrobacteraceae bacterium]|nr:hypothetical protein [Fibrobacteraceae bacterium]
MNKLILSILLLSVAAWCYTVDGVSATVADCQVTNTEAMPLQFHVENSDQATHTVRIQYDLPQNKGLKYTFERLDGQTATPQYCSGIGGIGGIDDAIVNLKLLSNSRYALDVQFKQPPGTRDFIIVLFPEDDGIIEKNPNSNPFALMVDEPGSPLDNEIVRVYKPTKRHVPAEYLEPGYDKYFDANIMGTEKDGQKDLNYWGAEVIHKNLKNIVDLNVPVLGAIKDTRMLMASFGEMMNEFQWNESTFDGHMHMYETQIFDSRLIMMNRCWSVAVFNLYNYYYGNRNIHADALTQDEMVFHAKTVFDKRDPITGMFNANTSEGAANETSAKLMEWAMPGIGTHIYNNVKKDPLTVDLAKKNLLDGKPIFISVNTGACGHAMLLDGVAQSADGTIFAHIVNIDNLGDERYISWENLTHILTGYILHDHGKDEITFTKTDAAYPVDSDSDGDKVCDFDEQYRFHSNPKAWSSDGDNISDYDEIKAVFSKAAVSFDSEGEYFATPNFEFLSWKDFSKYPYNDPNFNWSTLVPQKAPLYDLPDGVTLYAMDQLYVNDNTYCYNAPLDNAGFDLDFACDVVSEGERAQYSMNLGARILVKNAYTKGGAILRSGAAARKILIYREPTEVNSFVSKQAESIGAVYYPHVWPFAPIAKLARDLDVGNQSKIVKREDGAYTLKDGDRFKMLKVESGAKLIIGKGEMYIGDIQIDAGATYTFENPGYATELHLNGNFTWRGTFDASSIDKTGLRESVENLIARSFKIFQHSERQMYVDVAWNGTIFAPYASLVLGQTQESKVLYGRFLGKNIYVHQSAKVYNVDYRPTGGPILKKAIAKPAESASTLEKACDTRISSISRNEIRFSLKSEGMTEISIMSTNGKKVFSVPASRMASGENSILWSSAGLSNGLYVAVLKHNGSVSGKSFMLK